MGADSHHPKMHPAHEGMRPHRIDQPAVILVPRRALAQAALSTAIVTVYDHLQQHNQWWVHTHTKPKHKQAVMQLTFRYLQQLSKVESASAMLNNSSPIICWSSLPAQRSTMA